MNPSKNPPTHGSHAAVIGALGVVFGDIGTSPLYAVRECFAGRHGIPAEPANILGVLSMVFWTLTLVISIKYIVLVLRADNQGEGGILALMALVTSLFTAGCRRWKTLTVPGIFGASLLLADAMITPAISVLSAVEGLSAVHPDWRAWILPVGIGFLIALFAGQHRGTGQIGMIFGPVMMVWFVVIGVLGLASLVGNPSVLTAIDPRHAIYMAVGDPGRAFTVLGSVFLTVTGAEAMYADMGHFGIHGIRKGWFAITMPCLLLNYFGQGALLLRDPGAAEHLFYAVAPHWLRPALLVLATAATLIASQAVIAGAFSLATQAVQLDLTPRLMVRRTSAQAYGQVYVPAINWMLMAGTVYLAIEFGSSSNLAAAYGVAVSLDMTITTILLAIAAGTVWKWAPWKIIGVILVFLPLDLSFVSSNLMKIASGGWLPLLVAFLGTLVMTTWSRGRALVRKRMESDIPDLDIFLNDIRQRKPQRVAGTSVFLTENASRVPRAWLHNFLHNKIVHRNVLLLSVRTTLQPTVSDADRVTAEDLGDGIHRVTLHYGFMQQPNVPEALGLLEEGIRPSPGTTSYFLGRVQVSLRHEGKSEMALWRRGLFAWLARNAMNTPDYFRLPPNRVIELGAMVPL